MKKSRRHDLKTNVLSTYLHQAYETAGRYANYIVGGVVVVVVILVAFMIVQRNRQAAMDQAQKTYYEISTSDVRENPGLIDQAGRLAVEQGLDSDLGLKAAELQAGLAYDLAMSMGYADREKKAARFKEAKQVYEQLLAKTSQRPVVADRLRMSLAAVEESLAVLGQGDAEPIRRLYQEIIGGENSSFKSLAEERLKSLDDRLARLTVVATRPAPPPPAMPARTQPTSMPMVHLSPVPPASAPAEPPTATGTQPAK